MTPPDESVVFLIVTGCGDYYCENCHPTAAFPTKEAAEAAIAESPDLRLLDDGWIMDKDQAAIWEIPWGHLKTVLEAE